MATTTTVPDFVDCVQQLAPSRTVYDFLHQYDRMMFAASCKACLSAFINYLENIPKDKQLTAKSFALRNFILRPNQEDYYPMSYLHQLKKVNSKLHPAGSPEYVGQLRKALYSEDRITLRILIDFGVDASKIMKDLLRKNFYIEPDTFSILLSSSFIDISGSIGTYHGYPLLAAAIFLDKYEFWSVLQHNKYNNICNWDYMDDQKRNLAYWSVCSRSQNIFKFLKICLIKKVNMNSVDIFGNPPAAIAVKHKKLKVLKYLVEECKIDLNIQNNDGNTVAHAACDIGAPKILKYLIESGANLNIKNKESKTPIDFADMYYFQPLIDVLKDANLWKK